MEALSWLVVGAVLALLLLVLAPRRPADFPPGPTPWPWLGNVREQYRMVREGLTPLLEDLEKRYGKVIGLVLAGGVHLVVIRDFDLMKEAFQSDALSGRPTIFALMYRSFMKKQGIVFGEGKLWVEQRRFALRHLRQLGFGKTSMEDNIRQEYGYLAEQLRARAGEEVNVKGLFNVAIVNGIWHMVAGERFELDDPRLHRLIATIRDLVEVVGIDVPMNIWPPLRHLLPRWSGFRALAEHRRQVSAMFAGTVAEHRRTRDAAAPRDLIDLYLAEQARPGAAARGFTDENLSVVGMDLFSAGSDTTSHTLTWALLLLARHPAAQRRLQAELDARVGRHRLPLLADLARLPYCQAVLDEVLRVSSLLPLAVPHCASFGAAPVGAHRVPAGTIVLADLRAVHEDAAYWRDADRFRPERFVDDDGSFRRDERVVAFGFGRRQCLGEPVARFEFFLFVACLFHQFHVRLGTAPPVPSRKEGVMRFPPSFTVVMEPRA